MKKLKDGVNHISNEAYHADSNYLSSSSLKLMLKDAKQFHKEKILKDVPPYEEKSYFTEGSYIHSLILEPHQVSLEYAFFDGMRKSGKEWEAFKEANKGKMLLSKPQKLRCGKYFDGYKKNKLAQQLIKGGEAEHTICMEYMEIPVKVRCDYINVDEGYIVDVKTSAFTIGQEEFKITINNYRYDLSAALYLEIIEQFYEKPFEFYFVVISKKEFNCEVYKLSKKTRQKGKNSVLEAIIKYKKCLSSGKWSDTIEKKQHQEEILEV